MKAYLFNAINRYKRFSEELDAKTILCNKAWWVFNDSGEKEVYIFNADGTLIISVSGRVTNATWQYVSANKSLIISGDNQSYMVRPVFYDNMVFALQIDGTNECVFLIDENNLSNIQVRSLSDLNRYFDEKEKKELLKEEQSRQAALQAQIQREIEEDKIRKQKEEETERNRIYWLCSSLESKAKKIGAWTHRLILFPALFFVMFNSSTFIDEYFKLFILNEWHSFLFEHIGYWTILVGLIEFVGLIHLFIYLTLILPTIVAYNILVQKYEEENWNDTYAISHLKSHMNWKSLFNRSSWM